MTREVLYEGQSMDHPKINPLFAGRATRYAYFNGSFHVEDQSIAGPPQVCKSAGPEQCGECAAEALICLPYLTCLDAPTRLVSHQLVPLSERASKVMRRAVEGA